MDKKKLIWKAGRAAEILMYIILVVQIFYVFTGNTLHEILGVGFFICLAVHLIIKRKHLPLLLRRGNKSDNRRFSDAVIILLFAALSVMILSSMGVSRLLFPWFRFAGGSGLHVYTAAAVFSLSVLHGGMYFYVRTKKKRMAVLIALACAASLASVLALVPYLDRHFKVVSIRNDEAVSGEKIDWNREKPLVVYFTRVGNTNFEPDVDAVSGASLLLADGELKGNTQLLAEMTEDAAGFEVRAITLTGERYPSGYNATVSVAGRELHDKARPAIEQIDISCYEEVILIYPLWWGTVPMPVATFLEENDFTGKKLYLIATQGSSGYGSSAEDISAMAKGAEVHRVMSIYCDDIPDARERITDWLRDLGDR